MTNAVNLASAAGTGFAFRNRIINGDMRIDQRNNGAAVTADGYSVDRIQTFFNTGTISRQQSTVAPTGFTNSFGVTVSSAGTRNAGDYAIIQQPIEGYNVADLGYGAANAQSVTVSFWVRSSIAGLYSGALTSASNTRAYGFQFNINSANTWEYKTVTVPGDVAGTHNTTNGIGIILRIDLGSGSNFQTTLNSWQANSNRSGTSGTVSWNQTVGATFYLTGVQLEVGSVATPFERRPYGLEEMLCKRYFQYAGSNFSGGTDSSSNYAINISFSSMRAIPTVSVRSGGYFSARYAGGDVNIANPTLGATQTDIDGLWTLVASSGLSANIPVSGRHQFSGVNNFLSLNAEL